KAHRGSFDDLPSFIRGLGIEVTFKRIGPDTLARAAQLSARTNQFNLRKSVRSQEQLLGLLQEEGIHGWIVHVQDKFGDYGLTGLLIATHGREDRTLTVDTLLMSCRILGRDVENCMVRRLASLARQLGCTRIRVPLVISAKNAPIREFLDKHFSGYIAEQSGRGVDYVMPLDAVAQVAVVESIAVRDETVEDPSMPVSPLGQPPAASPSQESGSIAAQLCRLVQENLGLEYVVRPEEGYFSLGGNSLKAVDLVVAAGKQGMRFALEDVITSRTIGALARRASVDHVRPSQPQRLAAFALLTEAERRFVDEKYDLLELDDAFPLSTLQQGMIYHSLQDKSLYENLLCWFVDCEWNEKAFIKALRTVQHRHEAL